MIRAAWCFIAFTLPGMAGLHAQAVAPTQTNAGSVTNIGDYFSAAYLAEQTPQLLERARAAKDGLASIPLKRYPGNMLNLMIRTQSGTGEMHANASDVLIALDGEADIITGGTLVDRTEGKDGESRGTRTEGGVHHVMHKGDIIHIAPSTPHWTVLPNGSTFTFFAVKIAVPAPAIQNATAAPTASQPR